jgi:hypothetical protein
MRMTGYAPFNTGMMPDGFTTFFPKGLGDMICKWSRARRRLYDSVDFIPAVNMAEPSRFLGFEFYWFKDRAGITRAMRRTAPAKQRTALQRMKTWLNRRSQRKSYTREKFKRVLEYMKIPKPRPTEKRRLHQCALG